MVSEENRRGTTEGSILVLYVYTWLSHITLLKSQKPTDSSMSPEGFPTRRCRRSSVEAVHLRGALEQENFELGRFVEYLTCFDVDGVTRSCQPGQTREHGHSPYRPTYPKMVRSVSQGKRLIAAMLKERRLWLCGKERWKSISLIDEINETLFPTQPHAYAMRNYKTNDQSRIDGDYLNELRLP